MLGIGSRLDKAAKIKVLSQMAKQHNHKYDDLISKGVQPEQAAQTLQQQQFHKRHKNPTQLQPYNNSTQINPLGGTVTLGYMETHKNLSATKNMYQTMDQKMRETKEKGHTKKTPQQIYEYHKLRERVDKDHIQQVVAIDLGEKINSNYKSDYVDDNKMNHMRENRDTKYNARKNQMIWYAQTYIKTKDSLRKC